MTTPRTPQRGHAKKRLAFDMDMENEENDSQSVRPLAQVFLIFGPGRQLESSALPSVISPFIFRSPQCSRKVFPRGCRWALQRRLVRFIALQSTPSSSSPHSILAFPEGLCSILGGLDHVNIILFEILCCVSRNVMSSSTALLFFVPSTLKNSRSSCFSIAYS